MSSIDKPYSFHTLFDETFMVSRQDLGRKPDQPLTTEAQKRFLEEKVPVKVDEIVIPKMQRDYAQGRPNEAEVRENFLDSLYGAIVDETGQNRCSLNFIYGHFLESQERAGAVSFVPYDGQQRLTTLFLLHWYASRKENASEECLHGFRYDTRFSSTTFTTMFLPGIRNLFLSKAEAEWLKARRVEKADEGSMVPVGETDGKGIFSQWLMNKNGFAGSWQDDPTVRGMLKMLDAIHVKFCDVPDLWKRLRETDPSRMPIYFFFQEVSRSSEAGSTFIKMNSRGKLLTEFECFKADFLRLLRKGKYPEAQREELAAKINKTWEQSFWNLAKRQNFKDTDTDVLLMRYVNFVIDLVGLEQNQFQSRNKKLHLYSPERLKKVLLFPDGSLNETVIKELVFAVDTWCGADAESKPDEYFQSVFRKEEQEKCAEGGNSRIRLFSQEPKDIFLAIVHDPARSTISAVAVFHAVLVARQEKFEPGSEPFDSRMRSIRNLVYSMDAGAGELPYILQKVRLVMQNGMTVDFSNAASTRKFTEAQIREERLKEWLEPKDSNRYLEIRKLEESDWFKGQVGALLHEALDKNKKDDERLTFLDNVFAKRAKRFARIFCAGDIPASTIRKALFSATDIGFAYWVPSKNCFWMGASSDDFAWKAERPYFTRDGNPQKALRHLLGHPFFDTAEGSGKDLLAAFANRPRSYEDKEPDQFDVLYYLNRYYDDFFERWTENEVNTPGKCVGRVNFGNGGLTMQMLEGQTRRSLYWDPYLFVALKHVDEESVKDKNEKGAFKGLLKQSDVYTKYSIAHRGSDAEIWNDSYGVRVKAGPERLDLIKKALEPSIALEEVKDENTGEVVGAERLLRTRAADDKKFCDFRDRIEVCEKVLQVLKEKA